jgi:hypothetical protein
VVPATIGLSATIGASALVGGTGAWAAGATGGNTVQTSNVTTVVTSQCSPCNDRAVATQSVTVSGNGSTGSTTTLPPGTSPVPTVSSLSPKTQKPVTVPKCHTSKARKRACTKLRR